MAERPRELIAVSDDESVGRLLSEVDRLGRYVSTPARNRRADAAVERLCATVLFSDLRGFTATSLVEDPERLFGAVNEVLGFQTECVLEHGGYVDKFSGDGLLAVFEGDDAAARAAAAAVEIVRQARTMHSIAFWSPPPVGLGLHHGAVLRGELGAERRKELTVIGPTVNVAARLCGQAGALEVVASEAVVSRAPGVVLGESRLVSLKGVPEPLRVYNLVCGEFADPG